MELLILRLPEDILRAEVDIVHAEALCFVQKKLGFASDKQWDVVVSYNYIQQVYFKTIAIRSIVIHQELAERCLAYSQPAATGPGAFVKCCQVAADSIYLNSYFMNAIIYTYFIFLTNHMTVR